VVGPRNLCKISRGLWPGDQMYIAAAPAAVVRSVHKLASFSRLPKIYCMNCHAIIVLYYDLCYGLTTTTTTKAIIIVTIINYNNNVRAIILLLLLLILLLHIRWTTLFFVHGPNRSPPPTAATLKFSGKRVRINYKRYSRTFNN